MPLHLVRAPRDHDLVRAEPVGVLLARTLAGTGGNQSQAARRLGLSRSALIDRLKKYRLTG